MEFTITRATPADRQAVLELSNHFTEDYLEYTVDRWISQEKGGLYLVWDSSLLVGCCSLYFPSPTEGWLQGMRVHPDYQGRGIAYQLNRFLIKQAQAEGAEAARLLTSQSNHPALKVAYKLGFTPAGGSREIIFRAPINANFNPAPSRVTIPRPCRTSELERAAYFLEAGPLYSKLQGFFFGPGYHYRRLKLKDLQEGIKNKRVYLFEEQGLVSGLLYVLLEESEGHLILSYIDAPLKSLTGLLPLFKTWLAEGCHQFTVNLLADQHQVLHDALEGLFGNYEYEQWLLMEKDFITEQT